MSDRVVLIEVTGLIYFTFPTDDELICIWHPSDVNGHTGGVMANAGDRRCTDRANVHHVP